MLLAESRPGHPTVFYQRVPLVGMFLAKAYESACVAKGQAPGRDNAKECIETATATILWSALALEGGANEFAENVIPVEKLEDFDQCRKEYVKPKGVSRTTWKWHLLFKLGPKVDMPVSGPLLADAEALMQVRHLLAHYRPQDAARKLYYTLKKEFRDGKVWQAWDHTMRPDRVEPSAVEARVIKDPHRHYVSVRALFLEWVLRNGGDATSLSKASPELPPSSEAGLAPSAPAAANSSPAT